MNAVKLLTLAALALVCAGGVLHAYDGWRPKAQISVRQAQWQSPFDDSQAVAALASEAGLDEPPVYERMTAAYFDRVKLDTRLRQSGMTPALANDYLAHFKAIATNR